MYDVSFVLGETETTSLIVPAPVIESEFATEGFLALLGRDVLRHCRFIYDGPEKLFTLEYQAS